MILSGQEPKEEIECLVKIRLASRPVLCKVSRYIPVDGDPQFIGDPWLIKFQSPQRAVACGQSAVLYKDNVIIGGGFISKSIPE